MQISYQTTCDCCCTLVEAPFQHPKVLLNPLNFRKLLLYPALEVLLDRAEKIMYYLCLKKIVRFPYIQNFKKISGFIFARLSRNSNPQSWLLLLKNSSAEDKVWLSQYSRSMSSFLLIFCNFLEWRILNWLQPSCCLIRFITCFSVTKLRRTVSELTSS